MLIPKMAFFLVKDKQSTCTVGSKFGLFSGLSKEKAGRNNFGIKLLEPKDVFCLYFHVARLKK